MVVSFEGTPGNQDGSVDRLGRALVLVAMTLTVSASYSRVNQNSFEMIVWCDLAAAEVAWLRDTGAVEQQTRLRV